jgi:hypothetical protein
MNKANAAGGVWANPKWAVAAYQGPPQKQKNKKDQGPRSRLQTVIRPDFVLNGFLSVGFQTDQKLSGECNGVLGECNGVLGLAASHVFCPLGGCFVLSTYNIWHYMAASRALQCRLRPKALQLLGPAAPSPPHSPYQSWRSQHRHGRGGRRRRRETRPA